MALCIAISNRKISCSEEKLASILSLLISDLQHTSTVRTISFIDAGRQATSRQKSQHLSRVRKSIQFATSSLLEPFSTSYSQKRRFLKAEGLSRSTRTTEGCASTSISLLTARSTHKPWISWPACCASTLASASGRDRYCSIPFFVGG